MTETTPREELIRQRDMYRAQIDKARSQLEVAAQWLREAAGGNPKDHNCSQYHRVAADCERMAK